MVAPEAQANRPPLLHLYDLNVADAIDAILERGDLTEDQLLAQIAHEQEHPKFAGGRRGVLDAIQERIGELRQAAAAAAGVDDSSFTDVAAEVQMPAPSLADENPPQMTAASLERQKAETVLPAVADGPRVFQPGEHVQARIGRGVFAGTYVREVRAHEVQLDDGIREIVMVALADLW
jgi:hypothetical protein